MGQNRKLEDPIIFPSKLFNYETTFDKNISAISSDLEIISKIMLFK